jgi:hypothetical protein
MALRAALALADVCTVNHLVIIFFRKRVTRGIDIDGVHVHHDKLRSELCLALVRSISTPRFHHGVP